MVVAAALAAAAALLVSPRDVRLGPYLGRDRSSYSFKDKILDLSLWKHLRLSTKLPPSVGPECEVLVNIFNYSLAYKYPNKLSIYKRNHFSTLFHFVS